MSVAPDEQETRTASDRERPPVRNQAPRLPASETVGRYRILSLLGVGGMGQVYSAYDPNLDRRVAIKLLHRDETEGAQRLSREARALARISHPNVVTVHEVDEYDGRIAIAMEYVEGETLREWARRVTPAEGKDRMLTALDYLLQAGRGLAAAHAEGFVHRDFKPSNVLVGKDGRVRVADFGLAQLKAGPSDAPEQLDHEAVEGLRDELTAAGTVVGTPAYMAPEQRLGEVVDVKSDQFSFCLTAWEVLTGERPELNRRRRTTQSQLEATLDGETVLLPSGLEAALRKGLSKRPKARFSDLPRLLEALETENEVLRGRPSVRRWFRRGAVAVGALAALGFAGVQAQAAALEQQCETESNGLAEVLTPAVSESVDQAIRSQPFSYASHTADQVSTMLEDVESSWREDAEVSCRAFRIEKEWSEPLYARSQDCLLERRLRVQFLVESTNDLDGRSVSRLIPATHSVLNLPRCDKPQSLPPRRQAQSLLDRSAYLSLMGALGEGRHALATGRPKLALERAKGVREAASSYGFEQLATDAALLLLAGYADHQHTNEAIGPIARAQYSRATERGDWPSAQLAALHLAQFKSLDIDVQREWLGLARAASQRIERPSRAVTHRMDAVAALQLQATGNHEAAAEAYIALLNRNLEDRFPSKAAIGSIYLNIASSYGSLGDYERATTWAKTGWEHVVESLGPGHPAAIDLRGILGGLLLGQGQPREALEHLNASLEMALAHNVRRESAVSTLGNIGYAHRLLGESDKASAAYEQAIVLGGRTEIATNYAVLLQRQGRVQEAIELLESALADLDTKPATYRLRSNFLLTLGRLEGTRDRFSVARAYFARAVAMPPPDIAHPPEIWLDALVEAACIGVQLGETELGFGQLSEAHDKSGHIPGKRSWVAKRWAEALWDAPGASLANKARARALMLEANAGLKGAGPRFAKYVPETETWLETHTR